MASLPPQPPASQHIRSSSPQHASPRSEPEGGPNSLDEQPDQTSSTSTNEYAKGTSNTKPSPSQTSTTEEQHEQAQLQPQKQPDDNELRKCWICFADETEDTPTTSAWRSPCPCALTAHEACLLDWVADLEAPSSRNRSGVSKKIECPQCKSKINIARPRSFIVEGVNAIDRVTGKLVVPGIVITLAGSLFAGCWIHGFSSVFVIFGTEDANRLFGIDTLEGVSTRWGFGLPLIPVVLVMSRTSIGDGLLPILPIFFFATQIPDGRFTRTAFWPPSAAMTIATLPYMRAAYNEVYKRLFAERERRWIKEVQPRAGETGGGGDEGGAGAAEGGDADANVDVGFELNLEVEIFEEREELAIPQQGQQGQQGQPPHGVPDLAQVAAPEPAPVQRPNNLVISTSRVADTVIGALLFPTISAAVGAMLKLSLPRTWTTPSSDRHRPGLLQSRWGRSIVGGCLFVVLKDTLSVYSRYRLAQDHKKRKVLDYDRRKGKGNGN